MSRKKSLQINGLRREIRLAAHPWGFFPESGDLWMNFHGVFPEEAALC
jgi:hypothetical protein